MLLLLVITGKKTCNMPYVAPILSMFSFFFFLRQTVYVFWSEMCYTSHQLSVAANIHPLAPGGIT